MDMCTFFYAYISKKLIIMYSTNFTRYRVKDQKPLHYPILSQLIIAVKPTLLISPFSRFGYATMRHRVCSQVSTIIISRDFMHWKMAEISPTQSQWK